MNHPIYRIAHIDDAHWSSTLDEEINKHGVDGVFCLWCVSILSVH